MQKSQRLAILLYKSSLPAKVKTMWLKLMPQMSQEELFHLLNFLEKENSQIEALDEDMQKFILKQNIKARKFQKNVTKEFSAK